MKLTKTMNGAGVLAAALPALVSLAAGCGTVEGDDQDLFDGDVGSVEMHLSGSSCPVNPYIDTIGVAFIHERTGASTIATVDRSQIDANCAPGAGEPLLQASLRPGFYNVFTWSQDADGIINSQANWLIHQQFNADTTVVLSVSLSGARSNGAVDVQVDNASY